MKGYKTGRHCTNRVPFFVFSRTLNLLLPSGPCQAPLVKYQSLPFLILDNCRSVLLGARVVGRLPPTIGIARVWSELFGHVRGRRRLRAAPATTSVARSRSLCLFVSAIHSASCSASRRFATQHTSSIPVRPFPDSRTCVHIHTHSPLFVAVHRARARPFTLSPW